MFYTFKSKEKAEQVRQTQQEILDKRASSQTRTIICPPIFTYDGKWAIPIETNTKRDGAAQTTLEAAVSKVDGKVEETLKDPMATADEKPAEKEPEKETVVVK